MRYGGRHVAESLLAVLVRIVLPGRGSAWWCARWYGMLVMRVGMEVLVVVVEWPHSMVRGTGRVSDGHRCQVGWRWWH